MKRSTIVFTILVSSTLCILAPMMITAQIETLGAIKYTPPKGWTKSAKEHAIVFSDINPAEGQFCFITLYAAGQSTGTPAQDFAREWKSRVVDPWGGEANPKTVTEPDNGWTAIAGGAPITFQGNKAFAFLTVTSGFGKTVTVLGILNDELYLPQLQAFVEKIDIAKTPTTTAAPASATATSSASSTAPLQYDAYDRLIIPPPTRPLTLADLAGQWGESDSINTRYVNRYSGTYAGADSLAFKTKMTITADGAYYDDFYAIQNGKMIKEKNAGGIAVNGRILVIKDRNLRKYVIRGWIDLPDMTILVVCGPWYENDTIPQEILNNPAQGANLDQKWVRKK